MEWRLAFTEFLFAFCAVVLADRVHGFSERLLAALGWTRPVTTAGVAAANDWYVHFHRRDITGEAKQPARPVPTVRPVARRPRPDFRPRLRA
jgi:hypothetical protein